MKKRQYLERNIGKTLEYIAANDIGVDNLSEWVRALVLPHLWGRDLIQIETAQRPNRFLRFLNSERHILRLTPFGQRELDQFCIEEKQALEEIS